MTQTTTIAPALYAVIPFIGFAVLAALSVTVPTGDGRSGEASTPARVWPALPAIALVFSAVWCLLGNFAVDRTSLIIYTVFLTVCGTIASLRDWIRSLIARAGTPGIIVRDVCCVALVITCCVLGLELPWNETFPALVVRGLAIEVGLVTIIQLALYFLGQQSGALMGVGIAAACFAGIAQSFLIKFKGVSILPSDLFAMKTAISVGEGYSYVTDFRQLMGVMAGAAGMAAASLLGRQRQENSRVTQVAGKHAALIGSEPAEAPRPRWRRPLEIAACFALGAALAAGAYFGVTKLNFIERMGVEVNYGSSHKSYERYGFLTSFVAALQDFPIKEPEGYSQASAEAALEELAARYDSELGATEARQAAQAQFEEEQPTVIVVMNESFCDLSSLVGAQTGYEGPQFFRSVSDALVRGEVAVSVIGGGTCNTEFEFLTGNSYAFVGSGKYPYVTYDLSTCESMARQFANMGYGTHAIHPNDPKNWDRDEVYETLGFDEFHAIDEFEDAPVLHMGATDGATYDKVLEILSLDSRPQFIFDVTMQNHGSYGLGDIPEEQQLHYEAEGVDEADVAQLNEYLACIEASDRDLEAFMGELAKLDRKVVLVFFGDHQPAFTPVFNDLYFTEDDPVVHQERTHESGYFVWANYDIAGREQASAAAEVSADVLGAMTLDLIGAPLTTWQRARLAARLDVQALNIYGYLGADDVWYAIDAESPYVETYRKIAWLNYLGFGSKAQRY